MRNTEQAIRYPIKLESRAHKLPGAWSESPLVELFAQVLLCRTVMVLRESQWNGFWDSVKVWKNSHLFVFKVWCAFLIYSEIEASGKPTWCSAKVGFLFQTWWLHFRNLCGQSRQDVLPLLSLHACHVFVLSYGWSCTRKIRIWKFQLFNCVPRSRETKLN